MTKKKKDSGAGEENGGGDVTLFSEVLFNIPRHNLITAAAFQLLGANAKAKVTKMLGSVGMNEGSWGGWADQIKSAASAPQDAETKKFLDSPKNKSHKPWHYVNLPLKAASYRAAAADGFTREDDVVQMIRKCVLVLKGKSNRFSRVNALRLLGHLVGDVHQPLHVGCSFLDDSTTPPTMVFDQATIVAKNLKKRSDTGGNKILLPGAGSMHSFWDGSLSGPTGGINLLSAAGNSAREKKLIQMISRGAKKLSEKTKSADGGGTGGGAGLASTTPLEDLAQEWATESLKISLKAYQDLVMRGKNGKNYDVDFKTTKADYITKFRPVLIKQMKRAARRLADTLNAIYP